MKLLKMVGKNVRNNAYGSDINCDLKDMKILFSMYINVCS